MSAKFSGNGRAMEPPRLRQRRRHSWLALASMVASGVLALLFLFRAQRANWHLHLNPLVSSVASSADSPGSESKEPDSPWIAIKPSRNIEWHACYEDRYECARLDVPMDWLDPTEEERVVLAVLRLRAKNPKGDDYRGPLIFNPGGPGGSGIWALRDHGLALQTVVGDNYDIVSFDPRGIGASIPRIECWGSAQDRMLWSMQDAGVVDAHPGVLYDAFARATAFSQNCAATMGQDSILRHSSTTYHARDMLEILNRMGETKLKYWGFSYGTVLGGTFAAMYPEKVERLVSDGNVDYKEWYDGAYRSFLHDADKVLDAFFDLCHQAGPERCAFYGSSPAAIRERLDKLVEAIRINPIIVPPSPDESGRPQVITYSHIKRLISTTIYQPLRFFSLAAKILAALEKGDGQLYAEFASALGPSSSSFCGAETVPPSIPISGPAADTDDAFPAIMCADAQPFNGSVREFEKYALQLQETSTAVGAVQIVFRLSCVGWTVAPKWRFGGPFQGNTSFPILYIANIADNVTPLISAASNSAAFPGSVVLVQNSYGHTSLAAPSTCTARHVRAYFQDGKLPPADTRCDADLVPFYENDAEAAVDEVDELAVAVRKLATETNWGLKFQPAQLHAS